MYRRLDAEVPVQRLQQVDDHEEHRRHPERDPEEHQIGPDQIAVDEVGGIARGPRPAGGVRDGRRLLREAASPGDARPHPPERRRGGPARLRPDERAADAREEPVRQPDGERRRDPAREREALERGEDQVVGDEDREAPDERETSAAPVRAHGEREADQREHDGREGEGEALVVLDQVRCRDLALGLGLGDSGGQLAHGEVLLGFVDPGALERRLDGEVHVIDSERGVAVPGLSRGATARRRRRLGARRANREVHGRARRDVALVDRTVDEAERDPLVLLVRQEPPLARGDDARELRVPLVGHEQPLQRDLRGADIFQVDDHVAERRVEDPLPEPARGARL